MSETLDIKEPKREKPEAIILRSDHDNSIVVRALTAQSEELSKLVKKNNEAGYAREARSIQADCDAITQHILPEFHAQRELPLLTVEDVERGFLGALRPIVFRAFDGLDQPKIVVLPESVHLRRENLLRTLTQIMRRFALELADTAFYEGAASRAQTAESLAAKCIRSLREV